MQFGDSFYRILHYSAGLLFQMLYNVSFYYVVLKYLQYSIATIFFYCVVGVYFLLCGGLFINIHVITITVVNALRRTYDYKNGGDITIEIVTVVYRNTYSMFLTFSIPFISLNFFPRFLSY